MEMAKKHLFFILIILLFGLGIPINTLPYSSNELNDEIDILKEDISNVPDECWKRPADVRRVGIIRKLTIVQVLISDENYEEGYDKLLHDIKPKLTGLKTDENEDPWGNGIFKKPWLICPDYQEEFQLKINDLLSHIKGGSVPEDDTTGPIITVDYIGSGYDDFPSYWRVIVEDLESGLDEVEILRNGNVYLHETNLGGISSITYDMIYLTTSSVPVGTFHIEVNAKNNDKDYDGDQETSTYSEDIVILDDDTTAPLITIIYVGSGTDLDPGYWWVDIEDLESGIGEVIMTLNGYEIINDNLNGQLSTTYTIDTPKSLGFTTLEVIVNNDDTEWTGDQEVSSQTDSVEIIHDPIYDPPPLIG